jgi:hypothetical protein
MGAEVRCIVCGSLLEYNPGLDRPTRYQTCESCQQKQRPAAPVAAAPRAPSGPALPPAVSRGCGTVIAGILLLAVGYALLQAILPFLIGGVVLVVGIVIFYFVGKKIGFGKAILIGVGLFGILSIGTCFMMRSQMKKLDEEEAKETEESTKAEAQREAEKAKTAAAKAAVFQAGYTKLVGGNSDPLPSSLLGAWKVLDRGSTPAETATVTASMISGIDPNLTNVKYRVTAQHLAFVGAGDRFSTAMTCAGAVEPIGVGDRMLLGLECQNKKDGSLSVTAYAGSTANLSKELQKAPSSGEDSILPPELRGIWLAADDDCSKRKAGSKRRTIIGASIILGNGGNEDDGIVQVHASTADNATTFDGLSGPTYSTKTCQGRIESAGPGSYVMNIKCEDNYDRGPTQLCKKVATWQDLR